MVHANEVAFDVITKMWNQHATMAIVVSRDGGTERVLGVVTKEHVADTVASSVQIYPG
jgi:CIC family chloride channel protein